MWWEVASWEELPRRPMLVLLIRLLRNTEALSAMLNGWMCHELMLKLMLGRLVLRRLMLGRLMLVMMLMLWGRRLLGQVVLLWLWNERTRHPKCPMTVISECGWRLQGERLHGRVVRRGSL